MVQSISAVHLNNIAALQRLFYYKGITLKSGQQNIPLSNLNNQVSLTEMASAIRMANSNSKLPTYEDIINKFLSGELDPRKIRKGMNTFNINGQTLSIYVSQNGVFHCNVQGSDDSVRIFMGKNSKGQDCICLNYFRRSLSKNLQGIVPIEIPTEKYDSMIASKNKNVNFIDNDIKKSA